ncbi:MAG: GH1 family beta-glucosidase [Turicibacter sp.]|nr:GH1 family beta-glucosidase [Turicibacter sp.]
MAFKKDFLWGSASSSYQIEGAAYDDGKGLSIWDMFCKESGRVQDGHTGDVACDHYHRYKEDVALMKQIGLKAYRFSISWPRILPEGIGKVNEKGLKFYENLIDELIAADITPCATLFHWDYPQALHEKGGWLNPDSSEWFAEYTAVVANRLGKKLKNFMTLNEPQVFIGLAFQETKKAPGIRYSTKDALQMSYNVMLSHGKAVKVLREIVQDVIVGYAPTGNTFYPANPKNSKDIEAAKLATFDVLSDWGFTIAWWSDPVMLGIFPEKSFKVFGQNMPKIKPSDLDIMHQPLDYYGQNIYHSSPVSSDGKGGYKKTTRPVGHTKTAFGWPVTPEALYWPVKFMYERYKIPIVITENGMSAHDCVSLDGKVHDPNRINYMQRYLTSLRQAVGEGVDVMGYFHWSIMDNFEWEQGYTERFGLIYVDFDTQKRTLKDSAIWYKNVIESNGKKL